MHTPEQIKQFETAALIEIRNAAIGMQTALNFVKAAGVPARAVENLEQLRKATATIADRWDEFTSHVRDESKSEQPKPATPAKPAAAPRPPAKKPEPEENTATE